MGDATEDENAAAVVSDSENTSFDYGDNVGNDHGHGNAGEVGDNSPFSISNDGSSDSDNGSNVSDNKRMGTLQSARFNILSTMVVSAKNFIDRTYLPTVV